ncbi:hypothetical protein F3Y22_tig00111318pilonHSYRG00080 [Hibiscus syriacus]|uniref:Integrase catalytic domain-containing protein n=1 Tax=Hibiscus syriacus TaxID=106335 RepID=A0A6A2YQ93_HIBSY|nr:hypothetical protein F3Y22_tig00111318pilonHSYRG00080 [Hibiscus syriacus]
MSHDYLITTIGSVYCLERTARALSWMVRMSGQRWNEIVSSRRFLWNFSDVLSQKPWYFMFTSSDEPVGYAYDPILRKWYGIELPCIQTPNWFIASSRGLVCFMDNDSRSELHVCNPVTKNCKKLEDPPGLKFPDYGALSILKLKMKVILRKDGCLAAISERPVDFTDDNKWIEMDGNAMANFHLALADEVLSSIEEKKTTKEIWDHLTKFLHDSYDQLIINLTNSNVTSLVFDDVAAAVLQEENRRKNNCNDHALEIVGVGTIKLKMYDGTIKVVQDVRHVKGLKKNLLSYGLLDNNASKIETQKGIMKVFCGALMVLKDEKIAANLYMLKGETFPEAEASVTSCSSDSAMLWHQKLGHIKQHRLKFNTSNSRGKSVLELVHSDVWQAPVASLGGVKYFILFIDDYSMRCWVYPIKKKSDVFSTFKNFKARVELDSGNKIKCFRTDNEGEYTSEEFDDFCRKEGIKRQFTVANTPQQNGVTKRVNITLTYPDVTKIIGNYPEVMKILGNYPEVIKILGNYPEVIKILGNYPEVIKILGNYPQVIKILGNYPEVIKILGNYPEVIKILGNCP